jgi:hypothetical protein
MLTREAVAAALALAGIRTGANVLDLAPAAGLTKAARAMAGEAGRVDALGRTALHAAALDPAAPNPAALDPTALDPAALDPTAPAPRLRYGYAIGVWTDRPARTVVEDAESHRPNLAPFARVTLGSIGSLTTLVDELRSIGWTVLHGTTVPDADPAVGRPADLALAVARLPE